MKLCQIINEVAWWIFEADSMPEFADAPGVVLKDITNLDHQPKEGWLYNEATDTFSPPPEQEPLPEPLPSLEEMQAQTLLNTEYLVCLAEISNL
ncbi:hypothetical protein Desde_1350 [Desulfitobacterium dehalogenans ATCC 51507]|uniref:Uncharacterized protein n=1 Tax=Desulfitobacterium dehalogenans (strain ATCC 51507 / DSM 9161 / JW/IU-DC1) TaxID=756499 RepID=I4A741_DESDJ|nr:hypothetical protein [Desulfitobacterium dehalogenans]AFL99775.1 hypothetical protein Desde_1350 [Desulfitobacterium dehalogenans ATCC 51507]